MHCSRTMDTKYLLCILVTQLLGMIEAATENALNPWPTDGIQWNSTTGCYSPLDTAVLMCTVKDSTHHGGTIWSGTAFSCPTDTSITNNRIFLRHSRYNTLASGSCNDGTITAEAAGVNGTKYTSTLMIQPVTAAMNGLTVQCSLGGVMLAGTLTLQVMVPGEQATPKPPLGTKFFFPSSISPTFMVIWIKPAGSEGDIGGFFISTTLNSCGQCTNIGTVDANTTNTTCSGWKPQGQTCNISVHTVARCHVLSNSSVTAIVHLTLPPIPKVTRIVTTYDFGGALKSITTTLANQVISDENGLPITFLLVYQHSSGGPPVEIPLECSTGSCTHTFEVEQTDGEYTVSVGAMTLIGKRIQLDNESATIGTTNTFVHVSVDVLQNYTIVNCIFFQKHKYISCQLDYDTYCNGGLLHTKEKAGYNASDITILLNELTVGTLYCFVLTAHSQSHTVRVQGSFTNWYTLESTPCHFDTLTNIILLMATIFMSLVSLIAFTAMVTVCCKRTESNKNVAVQPTAVYYSTVSEAHAPNTADPTYDEISTVHLKAGRDVPTEPNEAYHLVTVEPNDAYQCNKKDTI